MSRRVAERLEELLTDPKRHSRSRSRSAEDRDLAQLAAIGQRIRELPRPDLDDQAKTAMLNLVMLAAEEHVSSREKHPKRSRLRLRMWFAGAVVAVIGATGFGVALANEPAFTGPSIPGFGPVVPPGTEQTPTPGGKGSGRDGPTPSSAPTPGGNHQTTAGASEGVVLDVDDDAVTASSSDRTEQQAPPSVGSPAATAGGGALLCVDLPLLPEICL